MLLNPPSSPQLPVRYRTDHPTAELQTPSTPTPKSPVAPVARPRYVRFRKNSFSVLNPDSELDLSSEDEEKTVNKDYIKKPKNGGRLHHRSSILKKTAPQDGGEDMSLHTGQDLLHYGKKLCDCDFGSPHGQHRCNIRQATGNATGLVWW